MTQSAGQNNLFKRAGRLNYADAVAAIILLDDGRYLMQLRDDKPGIFYPGHWGLFGGAVESGEDGEQALRRELVEELDLAPKHLSYFTRIDLDFSPFGGGRCYRLFYEVKIPAADLRHLRLGEGQRMAAFELPMLLLGERVVPYDAFPLWMHAMAEGRPS